VDIRPIKTGGVQRKSRAIVDDLFAVSNATQRSPATCLSPRRATSLMDL
jgi:hypothetical protein